MRHGAPFSQSVISRLRVPDFRKPLARYSATRSALASGLLRRVTPPPSLTTALSKHNIGPSVVLACKAPITISGTGDHDGLETVITILWND
jgi:hypothetical protein